MHGAVSPHPPIFVDLLIREGLRVVWLASVDAGEVTRGAAPASKCEAFARMDMRPLMLGERLAQSSLAGFAMHVSATGSGTQ